MFQTREIYLVSVTLNDGHAMNCTLLSKPTPNTLAAVAAAQGQPEDFAKVLTVASEVEIPAAGVGASATEVTIAGVTIGTIKIETSIGYEVPEKKPRKPRQTADSATAAPTPTGKKRGRKPKNAPADAPTDTPTDTPTDAPADAPASID